MSTSHNGNVYATSQTPLQGASSPVRAASPTVNPAELQQKLTQLLQLIDELTKLRNSTMDSHVTPQAPLPKPTRDTMIHHDDEDLQDKESAEAYKQFEGQINALDNGLQEFQNAARQLGSSIGLLSSAHQLRLRLLVVLHLFRENAESLFPKYIKSKPEPLDAPAPRKPTGTSGPMAAILRRPTMNVEEDAEVLPKEMGLLAHDLISFLHLVEDFPEFVDEALHASVTAFQHELKYRSDCLAEYAGQFSTLAVRRYVHDLSREMGHHLDTITRALHDFVEVGVPTIRFAQNANGNNLLTLSTVATFFSGVTATVAQYSYDKNQSTLDWITNLFFFGSLVLSISAVINCLVGITWELTMYRSPAHRVPWWVMIWKKRSPSVFMIASVALFSAGLVCFCYASQNHIVAMVVLILTALCTFGLGAVSLWFVAERWAFTQHHGTRWLADIVEENWWWLFRVSGLGHATRAVIIAWRMLVVALRSVRSALRACCVSRSGGMTDSESLPTTRPEFGTETRTPSPILMRRNYTFSGVAQSAAEKIHANHLADVALSEKKAQDSEDTTNNGSVSVRPAHTRVNSALSEPPSSPLDSPNSPEPGTPMSEGAAPASAAIIKFRSIAWRVAMANSRPPAAAMDTLLKEKTKQGTTLVSGRKDTRKNSLRPQLKKMEIMHMLNAHTALVRHLQFSPNGRLLATCSWDHVARLWQIPTNMNDPVKEARELAHPTGFVGQVAWSPDGSLLLTKLARGIRVWTQSGVLKTKINRDRDVKFVAWLPSNKGFLSVEGSEVVHLGLTGNEVATYVFENMDLHNVAVTPDGQRLIGVGTLMSSPTGLNPRMSKEERRIAVYNIKEQEVENRVPILHDVRNVTLSRNGRMVLIGYENETPPQLWRIDLIKDGKGFNNARLAYVRSYRPKSKVDFAGPPYFGGTKEDDLVLVPTKNAEILIWARETGALLHTLESKDGGDLTGVTWNYGSDPFMLASASHDGTVRLWVTPEPPRVLDPVTEVVEEPGRC